MIRRAKEKDLSRIRDLLHQVQNVHAKGRPDLFYEGGIKYKDEEILSIIENDNTPVYVYLDKDEVVQGYGFCIYEDVKNNSSMCDMKTCYIDDICIDENCRRTGIGKKIYEHIVTSAKNDGCNRITLNVWDCNPSAIKFYESMGLFPLKTTMEHML